MKVKYFAWVRERIGTPEEDIVLPDHVVTGRELIAYLTTMGENYAHAFEQAERIRIAADQQHITHDTNVRAAREVALFPPMTGG